MGAGLCAPCAVRRFVAQPAAAAAHAVFAGRRGKPPWRQGGISFDVRRRPGADGAAGVSAPHRPAPRKLPQVCKGLPRAAAGPCTVLPAGGVHRAGGRVFPAGVPAASVFAAAAGRAGACVLRDGQLYAQVPAQLFLRHQKPLGLSLIHIYGRRDHQDAGARRGKLRRVLRPYGHHAPRQRARCPVERAVPAPGGEPWQHLHGAGPCAGRRPCVCRRAGLRHAGRLHQLHHAAVRSHSAACQYPGRNAGRAGLGLSLIHIL